MICSKFRFIWDVTSYHWLNGIGHLERQEVGLVFKSRKVQLKIAVTSPMNKDFKRTAVHT